MAKLTKKQKAVQGKIVAMKLYPVQEALTLAKETATAKFDESIDVAVNLGVDASRFALPFSPKAKRPRPPRLQALKSSVSTIWQPKSRQAI